VAGAAGGLPPWKTVYGFFDRWKKKGVTIRVHDVLRDEVRRAEGRAAAPTAAVIDSQSVKGSQTVTLPARGYDAGKKINGRKRFIVVDTLGLLLGVLVLPASRQDRDGARQLLLDHYFATPFCRHVFADGGFAGKFVDWAGRVLKTTVEIVRKNDGQKGSNHSRNAGSSSAPWPGSPPTVASPATTNATRPAPPPSSTGR